MVKNNLYNIFQSYFIER